MKNNMSFIQPLPCNDEYNRLRALTDQIQYLSRRKFNGTAIDKEIQLLDKLWNAPFSPCLCDECKRNKN